MDKKKGLGWEKFPSFLLVCVLLAGLLSALLNMEGRAAANVAAVDNTKLFREKDTIFVSFQGGNIETTATNPQWQMTETDVPESVKNALNLRSDREIIAQYTAGGYGYTGSGDTVITVTYPCIGVIQNRDGSRESIGVRMTVSDIYCETVDIADSAAQVYWKGTDYLCNIQFYDNFWDGFYSTNISYLTAVYEFFRTDSGEAFSAQGMNMTFNSLNCVSSLYQEGVEYLPADSSADYQAYVTTDTNIIQDGNRFAGGNNDFEDQIGAVSFLRNSVSFESIDHAPRIAYTAVNGVSYWHTLVAAPIAANVPEDPYKIGIKEGAAVSDFGEVGIGQTLTYAVCQRVQDIGVNGNAHYQSMYFEDTLPNEVTFQSAVMVKYGVRGDGTVDYGDRTKLDDSLYTLSRSGQVVTASMTEAWLSDNASYDGQVYALEISAVVNENAFDSFSNTGKVGVNGDMVSTAPVPAVPAQPVLSIVKTASKYEYRVGETIQYEVVLTQTKEGARAQNVVISDLSIPEEFVLQKAEITGVENAKITKNNHTWSATVPKMDYGDTARIAFSCEPTEAANGKTFVNTANAKADRVKEVTDSTEIYVNSAKLTVSKEAAGYEWRSGDLAAYTVKVKNDKEGTIARGVTISDESLPEGLALEGVPTIVSAPETAVYPVAGDKNVPGETQAVNVTSSITSSHEGGWTAKLSELPYGEEIHIEFYCRTGESLNGTEVKNTAKAKAENAEESRDDAVIWINSPGIEVEKAADIKKVKVGDLVTYTVQITNRNAGTLARNIVIEDTLDKENTSYAKIQKNSIVLLDSQGNKIENVKTRVTDDSLRIETGKNLVNKDDSGLKGDIGQESEALLTLEYQIKVISEDAAGEAIRNTVVANSDENIPDEDDDEVIVNGPHLDVKKESDQPAYSLEDTGRYKLTIRQTREGYRAKDVTIVDTFETEGMEILEDSIEMKLNGKTVKPVEITLNEKKNGFVMDTGLILEDTDKIAITYDVRFAREGIFVNTVAAKGSNTNESSDENEITVTSREAVLKVVKSSDKEVYQSGDTGRYTLEVTQLIENSSARQVIVEDYLDNGTGKICGETIRVLVNGEEKSPAKVSLNETATAFIVEIGSDISNSDKVKVIYDVLFGQVTEESSLRNETIAAAQNAESAKDDNTVLVKPKEPKLFIEKWSDKEEYQAGETARYTVAVKQAEKNATAEQLHIEDCFDREGMVILEDTIRTAVNGTEIIPQMISLNETKTGYDMEMGVNITDSEILTVTYDVYFAKPPEGGEATNIVTVQGDNAAKSRDENTVKVKEEPPETVVISDSEIPSSGVDTGDMTNLLPYIFGMILPLGAAGFLMYRRKRNKER